MIRHPDRMMIAAEHQLEPIVRVADFVPVKACPRVERLVIGGNARDQPGQFRNIALMRRTNLYLHEKLLSPYREPAAQRGENSGGLCGVASRPCSGRFLHYAAAEILSEIMREIPGRSMVTP